MPGYTSEREKVRWRTVGRLQGRIQSLYGGFCYIGATSIHGSQASGTMMWTVKWGPTATQAHSNTFRHAWGHYPHPDYATLPDMLYDLICALQEKLRAAEVLRIKHGLGTLKQMAAEEHLRLLNGQKAQT